MKRQKRKLASLKVKSFITDLNSDKLNALMGGSSSDETFPTTNGTIRIAECHDIQ